jgi:hypothetical protein
MVQWFVPGFPDRQAASDLIEAARKFAKDTIGWPSNDSRIYRMKYKHNGKEYDLEVGKNCVEVIHPGEEPRTEILMCILESTTYLICTETRGVLSGVPILVGRDEVVHIEYFDEENVR